MKKFTVFLAAVAAVLVLLVALSIHAREGAEYARSKLRALEAKQRDLGRHAPSERAAPPGQPKMPAAAAVQGPKRPPRRPDLWIAMNGDPKLMSLGMRAIRGGIDDYYRALFRRLKLSPQQIDAFETLYVNHQLEIMDTMSAASTHGLDPRADPNIAALLKEENQEFQSSQTALLGAAGAHELQEYSRQNGVVRYTADIARATTWSGAPMTGDQLNQLRALMANQSASYQAGGVANPQSMDTDAVYQQAQSFLQPEQLSILKAKLDRQKFDLLEKNYLQEIGMPTLPGGRRG